MLVFGAHTSLVSAVIPGTVVRTVTESVDVTTAVGVLVDTSGSASGGGGEFTSVDRVVTGALPSGGGVSLLST